MKPTTSQAERLRQARVRAGYASEAEAAQALGVKEGTYRHHENGTNGLSRIGDRYARFFHVRYEWLMTGDGEMLDSTAVPIEGHVGAGAVVDWDDKLDGDETPFAQIPAADDVIAFVVRGDSQWPRFYDGEVILAEKRPSTPNELRNQYAVVRAQDGRLFIKIVRGEPGSSRWRLESHNAAPIDSVEIIWGYRYLGSLARVGAFEPDTRPVKKKPKRISRF